MSNKCLDFLVEDDEILAACNRPEGHSGMHACGYWNWEQEPCPHCGAADPVVDVGTTAGFTGAAIYFATFTCCGHQEMDASGDNLEAVR